MHVSDNEKNICNSNTPSSKNNALLRMQIFRRATRESIQQKNLINEIKRAKASVWVFDCITMHIYMYIYFYAYVYMSDYIFALG